MPTLTAHCHSDIGCSIRGGTHQHSMLFSPVTQQVFSSLVSSRERRHPPFPPFYLKDHHLVLSKFHIYSDITTYHLSMSECNYILLRLSCPLMLLCRVNEACVPNIFIILRNSLSLITITEYTFNPMLTIKTRLLCCSKLILVLPNFFHHQ